MSNIIFNINTTPVADRVESLSSKHTGNLYLDFIAKYNPKESGEASDAFKYELDRLLTARRKCTSFFTDLEIRMFWSRVDKNGPIVKPELGNCWLWKNRPLPSGYGNFQAAGMQGTSHRIAYQIEHGEIASGLMVCHKCDVRLCCRPSHLFADTHKANMADMVNKERHAWGVRHWKTVLSEEAVQDIRIRGNSGIPEIKVVLSKQYNVRYACIDKITKGQLWKKLPWPEKS